MRSQRAESTVEAPGGPVRAVLAGIGLTLLGIFVAELFTLPAIALDPNLLSEPGDASLSARTIFFILNFVGMAAAGGLYLFYTDRGWDFVDLALPDRTDWVYTIGGTAVILLVYVIANVLITVFDIPSADTGILEFIGDDEAMVLILIAIAFLFNSPAEEFLFRNVIQKRLYAAFTRTNAIIVASAIFSLVHLPVYAVFADSVLAMAVPLTMLFVGGLILGYAYVETENLFAPIIIHAVYNSVIWGLLYISMVYDVQFDEPIDMIGQFGGVLW